MGASCLPAAVLRRARKGASSELLKASRQRAVGEDQKREGGLVRAMRGMIGGMIRVLGFYKCQCGGLTLSWSFVNRIEIECSSCCLGKIKKNVRGMSHQNIMGARQTLPLKRRTSDQEVAPRHTNVKHTSLVVRWEYGIRGRKK